MGWGEGFTKGGNMKDKLSQRCSRCGKPEKNYICPEGKTFVCSACVQRMLSVEKEGV